jgi:hypothetical protein
LLSQDVGKVRENRRDEGQIADASVKKPGESLKKPDVPLKKWRVLIHKSDASFSRQDRHSAFENPDGKPSLLLRGQNE